MGIQDISNFVPEVIKPKQRLLFKDKLKWTLIILVLFFIMGVIPLYGLGQNSLSQFEFLSVILGAEFGSLISLGIGPLVTASIILQLLVGSGLVKLDTKTPEGKKVFKQWQKLASIFFIIFEAFIYVFLGGLSPDASLVGTPIYTSLRLFLVGQIAIGGFLVMFMDDVTSKWGFGSGISLFIAAGVSKEIFIRAFSPLPSPTNPDISTGAIPAFFQFLGSGDPQNAILQVAAVLATLTIFFIAVYVQSMKVEVPLSFGRIRGHRIAWPLSFLYTSNIPVILVAALIANFQLWGTLLQNYGYPILGTFIGNAPASGLVYWLSPPNLLESIIQGSFVLIDLFRSLTYLAFLVGGAILFSLFWVQTSGMDAKKQAQQLLASGLQVPGFRRDERIIESILDRYITPLTVMGGLTIGLLAGLADLSSALTSGTGLLLTVMIIYKLYEDIAKQHMADMNPMVRSFIE